MRVRRDTGGGTGDDDEADIAFDSGVISLDSTISNASAGVTATTLGEFINVGTVGGTTYSNADSLSGTAICFLDTWHDQSGNAYHAEQATHTKQPKIHDGTVNTDLIQENGLPALSYDGGDELNYTWPSAPGSGQLYGEDYMWFSVVNPSAGTAPVLFMQGSPTDINTRMGQFHNTTTNVIFVMRVSAVLSYSSSTTLTTGQRILTTQSIFTSLPTDRDWETVPYAY